MHKDRRRSKISACILESLDEEKAVITDSAGTKFVVDIDTYLEKKYGKIGVGDQLLLEYYDLTENEDGSVTPEVSLISPEVLDRDVK